jgi:lysophospholipase L1-like esterase
MQRSGFLALAGALPFGRNDSAPLRILVLGDSLALATGASQPDGGFIFPLFRELLATHPGSRLDNVAIGGSMVADVLRLQLPQVMRSVPNIVIVCVGGNDVVRGTSLDAFTRTYRALLDALRRAAPRAQIICCGVPDVAASPLFADERTTIARRSAADDAAVRAAARARGARFVDLFAVTALSAGRDAGFFSADRFHPSDAGYALLRAALRPALAAAMLRY